MNRTVCRECHRGHGKFILRDEAKKASAILTEGGERWINPIKETTDLNGVCCMKAVFGS